MNNYFVWINGDFVHPNHAPETLFTVGEENALSVVRDFRIYDTDSGPAVFRLTEHIRQFLESTRAQGYEIHLSEEQLCDTVHRTLMYNGIRDGFVRTRLLVKKNWDPNLSYRERDENAFVLALISHDYSDHPDVDEQDRPMHSGIVLGTEVPAQTTLFLVKGREIQTPPSKLFGNSLVRNSVITLANDLGYEVHELPLTREHILSADEVFLSKAVGELDFVSEFDSKVIGDGRAGPVTRALQSAFYATMMGRGERSREWLEWVGATFLGL